MKASIRGRNLYWWNEVEENEHSKNYDYTSKNCGLESFIDRRYIISMFNIYPKYGNVVTFRRKQQTFLIIRRLRNVWLGW